ncbi:MAG: NUDIX hydrolase [Actinobacteria bacterium]|nr:NUDIX hydrolase [Actinomycetota bacterium]MCL6104954.1 NUDIX hydrolase [Actinomycetota bacterium]
MKADSSQSKFNYVIDKPIKIKDAATLILVRDSLNDTHNSLEVLLLRRNAGSSFVPDTYVFPGGALDPNDYSEEILKYCRAKDRVEANKSLKVSKDAIAWWVAAIRECFEEAGVLLAYRGDDLVRFNDSKKYERFNSLRKQLHKKQITLVDICKSEDIDLALDQIYYFSHWITPPIAPRRYSTRFFISKLPQDQVAVHDSIETVDSIWIKPSTALLQSRNNSLKLVFPTIKNLEVINRFKTVEELLEQLKVAQERQDSVQEAHGTRIHLSSDT